MNDRQAGWYEMYSDVSTGTVKELHTRIRTLLAQEDKQKPVQRKCLVREHPDFREQADVFEQVLKDRNEQFQPIDWSKPSAWQSADI